jgi:hypothetical protein
MARLIGMGSGAVKSARYIIDLFTGTDVAAVVVRICVLETMTRRGIGT